MSRTLADLLPEKPGSRLRIYAYAIHDEAHAGQLKVGQTTQDVKVRVAQQLKTAAIKNYTIVLDESAERADGTTFRDFEVRERLMQKGFAKATLEWVECSVGDVETAIAELRTGQNFCPLRHERFSMRDEQVSAVEKTLEYFQSRWAEDSDAVPEFLWNAKMRFGKTFAAYQLAKRLHAKRVLVVTFKPAVEDAWRQGPRIARRLERWQYLSKPGKDRLDTDPKQPLVYFGSFQDLLGRTPQGTSKPRTNGSTDELGPRDFRRVSFWRMARHREGTVRRRGREQKKELERESVQHWRHSPRTRRTRQ